MAAFALRMCLTQNAVTEANARRQKPEMVASSRMSEQADREQALDVLGPRELADRARRGELVSRWFYPTSDSR